MEETSLQKEGSGEMAISVGALVGISSQSQKSQSQQRCPSVPCLWCSSSWLLLGSSWHTAHEKASRLWTTVLQKNVPAFQSASLCGLRQLALNPCLTCAPVPPFSFFLAVGKPKAHLPGCYWHQHSCIASELSYLCQGIMEWLSSFFKNIPAETETQHAWMGLRHSYALGDSCCRCSPVLWAACVHVLRHCRNTVVLLVVQRLGMHLSTETGCINFISNHSVYYTNKTQSYWEMCFS